MHFLNGLRGHLSSPWKKLLACLLVVYVLLYGSLLWQSGGFPYITDNNESYCSLWHAHNLYHYRFADSCGLTDESPSDHAASHPYVHTHQGNFPRVFAFILYVLGIRSVEGQIAVTTFTVGLAVVVLAFSVLSRLGGPGFGFTATLFLITDYILFAQWQVSTYRIWHSVFVFLALRCLQGMQSDRPGPWKVLASANFACLFYYEFIFAAFVTLTAVIYGFLLFGKNRRLWLGSLRWQGSGALAGILVLFMQLSFYYGPENIFRDAAFTLNARNFFSEEAGREMDAFYQSHFAIDLQNNIDARPFFSIRHFVTASLTYNLGIYTPFFLSLCGLVLMGLVFAWAAGRCPGFRLPLPSPLRWLILAGACYLFLAGLYADRAYAGEAWTFRLPYDPGKNTPAIILAGLVLPLLLARLTTRKWFFLKRVSSRRYFFLVGYLVSGYLFLRLLPRFLFPDSQALWKAQAWSAGFLHFPGREWVVLAMMAGCLLILRGLPRAVGPAQVRAWRPLPAFFLAGLAAYSLVYFLSPGYLHSGYLMRHCIFAVYFFNALLAFAFYGTFRIGVMSWQRFRRLRAGGQEASGTRLVGRIETAIACLLPLVLLAVWSSVQIYFAANLPGDRYAFLDLLKSPPFHRAGIVTNAYPLPFQCVAKNWCCYLDEETITEVLRSDGGMEFGRGKAARFLWVRDRDDPQYTRPDYVLLMPFWNFLVYTWEQGKSPISSRVGDSALIQWLETEGKYRGHRIVARDRSGRDSWAIIKIHHPPRAPSLSGPVDGQR